MERAVLAPRGCRAAPWFCPLRLGLTAVALPWGGNGPRISPPSERSERWGEYRRSRGGGQQTLYSRFEEVLGPDHAETLMTYLPRYQADEFATKADIARLEARLDRLEDRLHQMQRTYVVTTVGSLTALTAIFSLVVTVFVG